MSKHPPVRTELAMRHGAAYDGGGPRGGVGPGGPGGGAPQEQSCLEQLLCALCSPICKELGVDLQQVQQQNNQEAVHLTQPQPQGMASGTGVHALRVLFYLKVGYRIKTSFINRCLCPIVDS